MLGGMRLKPTKNVCYFQVTNKLEVDVFQIHELKDFGNVEVILADVLHQSDDEELLDTTCEKVAVFFSGCFRFQGKVQNLKTDFKKSPPGIKIDFDEGILMGGATNFEDVPNEFFNIWTVDQSLLRSFAFGKKLLILSHHEIFQLGTFHRQFFLEVLFHFDVFF